MMQREIRARQHFVIVLLDLAWVALGFIIFFEARGLHGHNIAVARQIGYAVAIGLLLAGTLDVIRWHGHLVVLDSECVEVRHFWFFKKRYCRGTHNLFIGANQNKLEAKVDIGTLEVYIANGGASNLENLGNFKQIKQLIDARFSS